MISFLPDFELAFVRTGSAKCLFNDDVPSIAVLVVIVSDNDITCSLSVSFRHFVHSSLSCEY
jgi:hypothetical protein